MAGEELVVGTAIVESALILYKTTWRRSGPGPLAGGASYARRSLRQLSELPPGARREAHGTAIASAEHICTTAEPIVVLHIRLLC